jgi:hypothetical protein
LVSWVRVLRLFVADAPVLLAAEAAASPVLAGVVISQNLSKHHAVQSMHRLFLLQRWQLDLCQMFIVGHHNTIF